ncbi:hypothetical protein AtEden1_Chr3g0200301 [Arabidopsis thaliana]
MSDFQVVANTMTVRYSFCSKHVKFLRGTNMWHVHSLSTSKYFDFMAPIDVKYATTHDMNMLHGNRFRLYLLLTMGIITKVFNIRRFSFVCRERETNYESRYVKFTLTDNM